METSWCIHFYKHTTETGHSFWRFKQIGMPVNADSFEWNFCPICSAPRPLPKEKKLWAPMLIIYKDGKVEQTTRWHTMKPGDIVEVERVEMVENTIWPAPGFVPVEISELDKNE